MIAVPSEFAATLAERYGPAGREWAASVPSLVGDFCRRWGLVVDGPAMTGHFAVVLPVARGGEPHVLRLAALDGSKVHEGRALRHWAGRGAVLLLEEDVSAGAMLLERLDASRTLGALPTDEAMDVVGGLIRTLAVPGADGLPTVADLAAGTRATAPGTWLRLGRPVPRRTLDAALEAATSLPTSDGRMVHWDLWDDNVLADARLPWVAIDPRAAVGPPESSVAPSLLRRLDRMAGPADLDRALDRLVEAGGLDLAQARGWTVVRLVDYWLWALDVALTEDPARCARLLEWLGG